MKTTPLAEHEGFSANHLSDLASGVWRDRKVKPSSAQVRKSRIFAYSD
jgi:hypothetical protein